jgi:hypothetical protein
MRKITNQEVTYSTKNFKPVAEVTSFIRFLSKDFYSGKDTKTVELIRQAIGEFMNDSAIKMAAHLWTDEMLMSSLEGILGEKKTTLNEQYTATTHRGSKIFTLAIVSDAGLNLSDFTTLANNSMPSTLAYLNTDQYGSVKEDEVGVQFASISHQLQNLFRSLSGKMKAKWMCPEDGERIAFSLEPIMEFDATREKESKPTFQVLVVLYLPTTKLSDTKQPTAPVEGNAYLPCPICQGVEGCDHTVIERQSAAMNPAYLEQIKALEEAGVDVLVEV